MVYWSGVKFGRGVPWISEKSILDRQGILIPLKTVNVTQQNYALSLKRYPSNILCI